MGISQEDFDSMKDAPIASCPNGEPHVYVTKLHWLDRKKSYNVGVCDNCSDVTYSWYWVDDPPIKVGKDGKVR